MQCVKCGTIGAEDDRFCKSCGQAVTTVPQTQYACYYHSGEAVVGACTICGKNLCRECFDLTKGVCGDCAHEYLQAKRNKGLKNSIKDIVYILIGGIIGGLLVAYNVTGIGVGGGFIVFMGCTSVAGWRFINRVTKRDEKIIVSWSIIGIILKFMLSYAIGMFVAPFLLIWDIGVIIKSIVDKAMGT